MSYATESTAIRTRFYTEWKSKQSFTTAQMQTRVAWPNKTFTPPNGLSWVRLTILPSGATQADIAPPGSQRWRHTGVVAVQVFVPDNAGDAAAWTLAEQVAAIFRGVTASGVTYQAPYVLTAGPAPSGWYQLNVWAPYWRDSIFSAFSTAFDESFE